ncbi:hypothetical protein EP47_10420 [Legionella norrlandica]|uniref:Peptidase C39-like domain-containing protein n=1 Tax=Legionella norrlandica TaxID=1498499 RepID=A0A0A2SMZ5_9GAMM|nr:C39 family peptidase [Legionella norrlandica]KGP62485.1 hypothetical protein EP47_10420 [Legionella norrlandica]
MIELIIGTQPDDETCGPTSLRAIYLYYGLNLPLEEIIQEVDKSLSGGTLTPMLGKHALLQGFQTTIYIYNLNIFDLTWFHNGEANNFFLRHKLETQMKYKNNDPYIVKATLAYLDYLELGGKIRSNSLNVDLLKKYFNKKIPILTALSATYLYRSPREHFTPEGKSVYDDIRGEPCGHFVVLCGYDEKKRLIIVADPHAENPLSHNNYYKVSINRLINSIMLGVLTYDANLLIIEPKER